MRKVDPNGVRQDFISAVDQVEALTGLLEDVPAAAKQALELQMLSAVVYWEGFITDLFVAYINHDSRRFAADLAGRISHSVKSKFGEEAAARTTVALPRHLDRATVEALLDHSGRNLAVGTVKELLALAKAILPTSGEARITSALGATDQATVDAWLAIRNYVAHRSQAAWGRMNDALGDRRLPVELQRGVNNVNSVGKFLGAQVTGVSRAKFIFAGMRSLASKM